MIRDIDLTNKFEELYKKPVILYGAGYIGRIALMILRELGVTPEAFCDTDSAKKGDNIEAVTIWSLDELLHAAQKKELIVIIATASAHYENIVTILEKNKIQCKDIYTFVGLLYAVYFRMDNNRKSEKLSTLRSIWLYNQSLISKKRQGERAIGSLGSLLLHDNSKEAPVIVWQPGKVGSNTVEYSLRECGVEVVRSHGIFYHCRGVETSKEKLLNCIINSGKPVKMITLVREPVSRDIGFFFQKIDFEWKEVDWMLKGLIEKDFQQSFLNYLSVITPFDFTENNRKREFDKKIVCHIDAIGQASDKDAFWGWYDEELKNNFGIDILQEYFDIEKGYSIIKSQNIELLVIKLEKLDELEDVIAEFVGNSEFKIVRTNEAKTKSYKYVYKQFLEEVVLPEEYIDFYYKGNPFTKHFYGREEREQYYAKWRKHIQ